MASSHEYEVIVIVHPNTAEEDMNNLVERIKQQVSTGGGEVTSVESSAPWGRRRLAYPIRNAEEGFYHFMKMNVEPRVLPELERSLKLMEPILRYSIVRA